MNTTTTTAESPRIFLTDYASYNEGRQFEPGGGHWVDLDQFTDYDELAEYARNHFAKLDKKRPLGFGAIREEWMITDKEGIPDAFYSESWDSQLMESLFEWFQLDNQTRYKVEYIQWNEHRPDFDYCLLQADELYLIEYPDSLQEKYELFEQYYPEANAADDACPYLRIDLDHFLDECFIDWTANDGERFLVQRD